MGCVTIIGDSNAKRHMNSNNSRDCPTMLEAQVIQCRRMSTLSLQSIWAESNMCVLSCISNFITSLPAQNSSSLSVIIEPVFQDYLAKTTEACLTRPETSFMLCPPMYRANPIWYREGLPEILRKFSEMMKSRPGNAHMMPSFPSPKYDPDGVHLTAYSGLEYVLHMLDSIQVVLASLELDIDSKSSNARVLEDQVMVLEQDHRGLNQKFEHKFAVDAEWSDFQENIRLEPFFMVRGLGRLPKMDPKEWQDWAKADVKAVLSLFMTKDYPILYVVNSTGRGKDSITQYKVKVATGELLREIRDRFGLFSVGGDKRPPSLKKISIRNCVTPATLGRINILQLLARRYAESNPGSKTKVVGFEPRPLLKITPASDNTDKRVQTYNFIKAFEKLPTCFTSSEIEDLLQRISLKLHGSLQCLFVVLSDDMLKKKSFTQPKPKTSKGASRSSHGGSGGSRGARGARGARGSGGRVQHPPETPTELNISGSESSGSVVTPPARTSQKRGATTPASGGTASKK